MCLVNFQLFIQLIGHSLQRNDLKLFSYGISLFFVLLNVLLSILIASKDVFSSVGLSFVLFEALCCSNLPMGEVLLLWVYFLWKATSSRLAKYLSQ